jgi:hypothetical protein
MLQLLQRACAQKERGMGWPTHSMKVCRRNCTAWSRADRSGPALHSLNAFLVREVLDSRTIAASSGWVVLTVAWWDRGRSAIQSPLTRLASAFRRNPVGAERLSGRLVHRQIHCSDTSLAVTA